MKKLLLLVALILTGALVYYTLSDRAPKIQSDITNRLAIEFEDKNISDNISMAVSGRDVLLTGTVADEANKIDAGKVANALYGARRVDNNIKIAEQPYYESDAIEMPEVEAMPEIVTPEVAGVPDFNLDLLGAPDAEPDAIKIEMPEVEVMPEVAPEVALEPAPIEPAIDNVAQNLQNATLDGPLTVNNGRIITRRIIVPTTVEARCEGSLSSILTGNKINFETASATIKRNSYDLLDRMIIAAKNCDENTIITINGYTDNVGNAEYNRKLSLRRARAVGTYMLKRGVAKQVKVVGNGANDPIASNDTEEGRAQNRRIEFKVFNKKTN